MGADLAVVVPTRDRASRLADLLASLARQDGPELEIVVVDDGSADDTPALLAKEGVRLPIRVISRHPAGGPAAARNAGWQASSAPIVAFVDDDCVVAQDWSAALAAAHREDPHAVIQGRTEPIPGEVHRMSAFARTIVVTEPSPWFETSNIAYPRSALERLRGFDESFPAPAGEDTDLGWRAHKAGMPIKFVPGALVYHAIHVRGALALARESSRWRSVPQVVKRHPELRRELRCGVMLKRHDYFLLALLGVAIATRRKLPAVALVAPYVRHNRSMHNSLGGTIASLPAHLLVDSAELVALVRGSIRYRALVL